MNIKQVFLKDSTILGLGEDNKIYMWMTDNWAPFGWQKKDPEPAVFIPAQ